MPSTWKLAKGVGRVSSEMSTSQRNAGTPGAIRITSSSATSSTRRPWSGKGMGSAVWVGVLNGGLQSTPDTKRGLPMSSMSRMTKPPCQYET